MKKQFLKIAGVKSEKEFYGKYPTQEAFFKAHPEALKMMAKGGEAYPQTATMDNFFSYGVPVPPTYYAHGGAFPMAQPEGMFFSPGYGTVYNPYNKAMGGSNDPYQMAMKYPYNSNFTGNAFLMADGGAPMEGAQGQPGEQVLQQVVAMLQQGADPQQVVEELVQSGMPQEDAVATVQAIVQKLSQSQGQQQAPAVQQDPNSEEMMMAGAPSPEQGAEQGAAPMMGYGGQEPTVQLGVNGKLTKFTNSIKGIATNKANSQLGMGKMKKGGTAKGNRYLPMAGDGLNNTIPAAGGYKDVYTYAQANPLNAYQIQAFQNDQEAAKKFIEEAYRKYYDIDPSQPVYENDPMYYGLYKAYGLDLPGIDQSDSNKDKTNTVNDVLSQLGNLDINTLASLLTPFGRIKRKGWINGEFGRGRGNQYLWQTLFNTDNFEEALKQAKESGLNITEDTKGIFGKRKKYIYDWSDGGMDPTTGVTTLPDGTVVPSGTIMLDPIQVQGDMANMPDLSNMSRRARRLYKKSGYENMRGPAGGVLPGSPDYPLGEEREYESQYDPRGYYAGWSEAKNQRIQNKRRRIGEKLDELYNFNNYTKDVYNQNAFELNPRMARKVQRLTNRFNKYPEKLTEPLTPEMLKNMSMDDLTDTYSGNIPYGVYVAPKAKQAYGGQLYANGGTTDPPLTQEELKWLATSLRGIESANQLSGFYPDNSMPGGTADRVKKLNPEQLNQLRAYMQNTDVMTDIFEGLTPNIEFFNPKPKSSKLAYGGQLHKAKDGWFNRLKEQNTAMGAIADWASQHSGMANFEQRQNKKNILGSAINYMNDQNNPLMQYGIAESMYPGQQVNKGQFNPINGLNSPYGMLPARYDNFAAPALHGQMRGLNAPYPIMASGGSIDDGSVYMTDDEIKNFISMGGQVEFLD